MSTVVGDQLIICWFIDVSLGYTIILDVVLIESTIVMCSHYFGVSLEVFAGY